MRLLLHSLRRRMAQWLSERQQILVFLFPNNLMETIMQQQQ